MRVYSVGFGGQLVVDQFPHTALPRTYSEDSTRVSIEPIVRGANDTRLQLPSSRFPSYKVVDLADWLEVG